MSGRGSPGHRHRAVTIARSFTGIFSGSAPARMPLFILAQLAGAVLAALVFGWLLVSEFASKARTT